MGISGIKTPNNLYGIFKGTYIKGIGSYGAIRIPFMGYTAFSFKYDIGNIEDGSEIFVEFLNSDGSYPVLIHTKETLSHYIFNSINNYNVQDNQVGILGNKVLYKRTYTLEIEEGVFVDGTTFDQDFIDISDIAYDYVFIDATHSIQKSSTIMSNPGQFWQPYVDLKNNTIKIKGTAVGDIIEYIITIEYTKKFE